MLKNVSVDSPAYFDSRGLDFDFLNGFHDSANIVATMISSRAMTARAALTLVAVAEFAGFISPILGFVGGLLLMGLVLFLAQGATPKANIFFKQIQIPTAIGLALSHGGNDAQKTMGIITLGLLVLGLQKNFTVPWWVILLSATAIAGGWRIIQTLGGKFYHIRPIHSFISQLTSGLVVLGASLLGGPVSITQVVSSAILGVGVAQRSSQVRWGVMTIPAAAIMAGLLYFPLKFLVE